MYRYLFMLLSIVLLISCSGPDKKAKKAELTVVEGLRIGNRAPELIYPDPDGESIALSSLRGKIVLIDFWASWCAPCRIENPYLVATYRKYCNKKFKSGKGFTIYSISCDKEKRAWTNAIEKDKLIWKNHVSDLKGWDAEATLIYHISSIPSNILIDGNGIILAWNLRGEQLAQKLDMLLE
ncbi:MAG: TlpA family protein disulfide reductase [Bacteroidales bacterium]|nr:TlpA family protein disulfide reductase [Bacteroidales bacterium]